MQSNMQAAPIVWLVGASEGIGRALTLKLVAAGYKVVASARNAERLTELASAHPESIIPIAADVSDTASIRDAYMQATRHAGVPDIIIFNAGVYTPSPVHSADLEAALHTIDVNLGGMLRVWDVVRDAWCARRSGKLVIVSSVAAYRGLPDAYAYGASKAGLSNLTETLRIELQRFSIQVQLVSPGFVETRLTAKNNFAMPMIITAEDAAERIMKGIQSDKYEIIFPWLFARIMQLLRILPNRCFFWLAQRWIA